MPRLFVIMPFGKRSADASHTAIDIDFDYIYSNLIRPAGEIAGWTVLRIDEVTRSGIITNQYLKELLESDLVIADISLPNSNVFYELGIRQSISTGGTILVALEGSTIPFDMSAQRVFFYNLDYVGIEESKSFLIKVLKNYSGDNQENDYDGKEIENPIRSFLEKVGATVNPSKDIASFEQELQGRIERAQNRDQLIAVWKWVENLDPLPPFALVTLAERLSDSNDWSTSTEVLKKASKYRPGDFEIHRQLGWHLRHLGQDREDEALVNFRKALDLNPGDPETLGMIGGLFKRQEKYTDAADYYSMGAANSPNSLYMLVNQAAMRILSEPKNPGPGIDLYKNLIDHITNDHDYQLDEWSEVVLGEAYFAIGDIASAREHFLAASKKAYSPRSLRSAADQLELLARIGFRSEDAYDLIRILRTEEGSKDNPAKVDHLPILIHLSDLHFGWRRDEKGKQIDMHRFSRNDEYSQSLSQHIINEFSSRRAHFNYNSERFYILITGDLTYNGTDEEFNIVRTFLNEISVGLDIDKERIILVPGNHDINWNLARDNIKNRFDNYIAFLVSFYGEEIFRKRYPKVTWDLHIGGSRPEPSDLFVFCHNPDLNLTIVGLNSCIYENEQHHYGFIGGKQIRMIENTLDDVYPQNECIRVALLHHHLHPFPEPIQIRNNSEIWPDLSTIRDAGITERRLEKMGFDVILHGHKHKPQTRETAIRDKSDGSKYSSKLIVCGAGSTGVNATELEHDVMNQYEVIEFLRCPRKIGTDFLQIEWRELALAPDAEWVTSNRLIIAG